MNEEDINNRIILCEQRIEDAYKSCNFRTARGYTEEKRKWQEILRKLNYNDKLIKTNSSLTQIICKAIKYITENACYDKDTKTCCDDLNYNECDKLLEILGDKE